MAKPQIVSFISKYTEHELVRVPRNETPTAGLQWLTTTDAVKYKFYPTLAEDGSGLVGRLDVPVGSDKLVDGNRWLAPGQEQGIERDAPTALRAHVEFGASRDFWQMPVPAAMVRRTLRQALAALDADAIKGLMAEERDVANRADLLSEAQDALDLVNEQVTSLQAAQAEAEAEAEKAPKAKTKPKAPAAA